MTMKKVIVFILVLAIALGGIGFAHTAVTASQDDLLVYPTLEIGDPTALVGRTAQLTFSCGEHLFWHTDYHFGGEAVTEFVYSQEALMPPRNYDRNRLEVYLSQGMSTGVSGGSLSLNITAYGALLRAVSEETPQNGSKTMELFLSDYAQYYVPDYELFYEDGSRECSESVSLYDFLSGDHTYRTPASYRALTELFRFPVREGHEVSATIEKDGMGQVTGLEFYSQNSPKLNFITDVTAEGVWFVPLFRDESGAPLPYESPAGHGIYFIPWKNDGIIHYGLGEVERLTLDVDQTKRVYPLEEALNLQHMVIDAENGLAQMLTLEDGAYVLTTCDLETGTVRTRLEVLPRNPDSLETATFHTAGDYLLILAQGNLALTDAAGGTLYLTAPDATDQRFGAGFFDPDTGGLHFDGETLVLIDTTWHREGTFWAAAWQQSELTYYGEYDCSIMRGNDNGYYSYITAEEYPLTLK